MLRHDIEDVLRNHAEETRTIDQQIKAEQAQLVEDLEAVSKSEAARRTARTDGVVRTLEQRARQIRQVREAIDRLPTVSRCTLLMLYYPKSRTYEQAAELLDIGVTTLKRRRRTAVTRLEQKLKKVGPTWP